MFVKKMSAAALAGALLTASLPAMSMATEKPMQVEVNGKSTSLTDAQPFMDKNQRMQVPIRFISEALGAKVGYDAGKKLITLTQGSKVITLTTGGKSFTVNGQTLQMDTSAIEKNSRIYVPLRFVSQALDAQLSWDPETNSVKVTSADGVELKLKAEEPKVESTGKVKDWYGFKVEDHAKQLQEVEDVLRQKVNSKTVDSIMKYISSKTKREEKLSRKFFEDSKYKIAVGSPANDGIGVKIWYK